MTDTDVLELGPYVAGEVPEPFTHQSLDSAGAPIGLPGTVEATFVYTIDHGTAVYRDATYDAPTKTVTYEWVAEDLETPGILRGIIWITNGETAFASSDIVAWIKNRPSRTPPPPVVP